MFLWSLTGAVLPHKSFRQKRSIFTHSPTEKMKKNFSKETFCFKSCSEPCFGQIRMSHENIVARRPKVFGLKSENEKAKSRKFFFKGVPLVTARVVLITSPRISRHTAKIFLLSWSEIKMEEIYNYLKIRFFLQNFPLEPKKAILSAVLKRFFQKAERILLIVR